MLNADYFCECLCPVGWPHWSPNLCLPSPILNFKVGNVGGTVAPLCFVSCCVTVCRWLRNSHFLLSQPVHWSCGEKKKHLEPKLLLWWGYFKPLLSIVVPPLITVCDLLWRYGSCVPCPPNLFVLTYRLRSPRRYLGDRIQLISSVRAFSCSEGSVWDIPIALRYQPLCWETKETELASLCCWWWWSPSEDLRGLNFAHS